MKKIMALILTLCLLAASSTIAVAEAAAGFSAYSDAGAPCPTCRSAE